MISAHGTPEQKAKYLPRLASGELTGAFSMSEPALGSDVAAISTKAKRTDSGDYVITGQKMWLTNGGSSTLVAVLVKTDDGRGEAAQQSDDDIDRETRRFRRGYSRA